MPSLPLFARLLDLSKGKIFRIKGEKGLHFFVNFSVWELFKGGCLMIVPV